MSRPAVTRVVKKKRWPFFFNSDTMSVVAVTEAFLLIVHVSFHWLSPDNYASLPRAVNSIAAQHTVRTSRNRTSGRIARDCKRDCCQSWKKMIHPNRCFSFPKGVFFSLLSAVHICEYIRSSSSSFFPHISSARTRRQRQSVSMTGIRNDNIQPRLVWIIQRSSRELPPASTKG